MSGSPSRPSCAGDDTLPVMAGIGHPDPMSAALHRIGITGTSPAMTWVHLLEPVR
ncbi:hypothetical protein J4G37_06110 [Microvirga sp. 3-52]|nr:hypothetical protein [Microvirga sp. 3-52]